ncbi:MAG TPA: hypothetical protein VGA04_06750 [Streptosporangiaceae bacterium]
MVGVEGLSDAERQVWDAFPAGTLVDLTAGNEADDDPARGEEWGPGRQVSAGVLLKLLCGAVEVPPGQVGEVWLRGACITGKIDRPGVEFRHFLRLERCCIREGIDLRDATTPTLGLEGCNVGPISLLRTKINGALALRGAHLDGRGGRAMEADGLIVTGGMFCDRGFRANGEVSLYGASIGGELNFQGAQLDGRGGHALAADGLSVAGGVFCNQVPGKPEPGQENRFRACGGIKLAGASVKQLRFTGAQLEGAELDGKKGPTLQADQITVALGMYCDHGFCAKGEISLAGASVHQLSFSGAELDGKKGPALHAQDLTVTYEMFFDRGFSADGEVFLAGANIGRLVDDEESWPERIELTGLTYGDLGTYMKARDRLSWLNRSSWYSPQPYEQLAAYYRRLGHDEEARLVLLAKQRRRRRQHEWRWRWWGWLQDALAGYGYAPGRAMLLLLGAFAAGWLVFHSDPPAPANPATHPVFNAALYTLDVLIPAPALGQASDWDPHGTGLAVAVGLHVLGWLLAITVIAAITRSFSRN